MDGQGLRSPSGYAIGDGDSLFRFGRGVRWRTRGVTDSPRVPVAIMSIDVRYHCPAPNCVAIIEYRPLEQCGGTIECPRCRTPHPIAISDQVKRNCVVDRCAVCGGEDLFIRKDFPQRLGFAIVVVFGIAAIYAFTFSVLVAWTILASAVVLDLLIYFLIGTVTTCYRCRAEYRGCRPNVAHEGFDLATSEKY